MADEPVDMDTFRYDGHPPKSAEAAILLLCDTIEAAVRTLPNPTPEAMEEFIVKLVRGKLEDGQLSDSPLTFRDMDTARALFDGKINAVASIGTGDVRMAGMISQIDNVNRILDRVALYLA